MTKHELNACRMFLSDFPENWPLARILTAIEEPDSKDARWIAIWQPLAHTSRHQLSAAIYDAANFLTHQYGEAA